jgi:hypothetical protein
MKKYFIAITKTIKEDFDFPVHAETPEEAKKIAQELINKGVFGTSHFRETEVKIDMIRDENLKSVELND